jgi:tetratricopeptide (TPR) repeat protein
MGRSDEALAEITRARELDPLFVVLIIDVGIRHHFARRYAQAVEQFHGARELEPDSKLASYCLWYTYEQLGEYGKALAELRRLTRGTSPPEAGATAPAALTRERYAAALREELSPLLALRDRRILSSADVAAIHVVLGEIDLAFDWLEKSFRDRDSRLPWVKIDPRFDPLHGEARFEDLLRRLNLHS